MRPNSRSSSFDRSSSSLGSTTLTEGDDNSSDTYTVVLNTVPTDDVVVTLSPDAHLKTSATTLTFTTANWDVAQTVTVTPVNNSVADKEDPDKKGRQETWDKWLERVKQRKEMNMMITPMDPGGGFERGGGKGGPGS